MKKFLKISFSIVLIAITSTILSMATGVMPIVFTAALFAGGFILGIAKHYFGLNTDMNLGNLYDGLTLSDTTYAGEAASTLIVRAITTNETVQGGHIYVKDGIKKKFTIPRWDATFDDFIQDRAATPTPQGTATITGQTLTPADYMIYYEFNPRDYEDHWFATQLNPTLIDRTLPVTVESVVVREVMKRHSKYVNKAIWNNSTTLAATSKYKYYDGIRRKAAIAAQNAVSTPITLTNSNVASEFGRGYALIPDELKYDTGMKIFCSYGTYDLYMQYQIAQTNKGVDTTQMGVGTYRGLPVVKIPNFPADCYYIAKGTADMDSNLWMGINSKDDESSVQLSKLQANSELWFIKCLMKADVQIGWNEETVSYNIAATYG